MTSQKKNTRCVLLTFDYELFLGDRSGTVEHCLITPTNELLPILARHRAKSVFFIDTIYLHCLKELAAVHKRAKEDYKEIKSQLLRIADEGHFVFHHLHPHWFDARYQPEINQWSLKDYSHFAVAVLSGDERNRAFDISNEVMNEIFAGRKTLPSGFRAGGLFIQPFTAFANGFHKLNLKYDFSVLPGFKAVQALYSFDFSNASEKVPYKFEEDVLKKNQNGSFAEFPLSVIELKGLSKIINALWYRIITKRFATPRWGDGTSSPNRIFHTGGKTLFRTTETVSIELMTGYRRLLYQQFVRQNNYVHMIAHPKLISKSQLIVFDKFLRTICKQHAIEFDFTRFAEHLSPNAPVSSS